MSDCCRVGEPAVEAPDRCPDCGRVGRKLDRITLKALLRPGALARFGPGEHRFCPVADCPVVYFGRDEAFRREEVLVPVFQKEVEGGRIVCYCFGVSEDQIRREVETSGASASAERIKALVQSGRCACEVRNPQGTCCLGNVIAVARPSGSLPAPIPSELVSSASPE